MKLFARSLLTAAAIVFLCASTLEAQERAPLGIDTRSPHAGIWTINPFSVILGAFNGDVELNVGTGTTAALSATYGTDDDLLDYSSVDFTFRYYPGELSPKGFSVGMSLGYIHLNKGEDESGQPNEDETKGPAIGFIGGYTWLLGRSERLAIATGIGLKRIFAEKNEFGKREEVTGTGRLGIGMTF